MGGDAMNNINPEGKNHMKATQHAWSNIAVFLLGLAVTALIIIGAFWWITATRGNAQLPSMGLASPSADSLFQACVDKARQTFGGTQAQETFEATNVCYSQVAGQLTLRDYELRRQAFSTSQQEGLRINLVSMIVLLVATTSGIVLAALQMFWSFRLMSRGYEKLEANTEVLLKYNSVALRSSAVGVSIFAISMLFFAVFIFFNYQITVIPPTSYDTTPAYSRSVPLSPAKGDK